MAAGYALCGAPGKLTEIEGKLQQGAYRGRFAFSAGVTGFDINRGLHTILVRCRRYGNAGFHVFHHRVLPLSTYSAYLVYSSVKTAEKDWPFICLPMIVLFTYLACGK